MTTAEIPEELPSHYQYCRGCRKERAIEDFMGITAEYDPLGPEPVLCQTCRDQGTTASIPAFNPLDSLLMEERQLLALVSSGETVAAAARECGLTEKRARKLLSGESKPVVRQAFQMILREAGVTLEAMATATAEALTADRNQWNPEVKIFQAFPDHTSRLKAVSQGAKMLDMEEPEKKSGRGGGNFNIVNIYHNLDGPKPEPEDEFVARSNRARNVTPE